MHFRHTFATFLPKNLYFKKFGGENSNLAEFYSRFDGQLSISSGTAARLAIAKPSEEYRKTEWKDVLEARTFNAEVLDLNPKTGFVRGGGELGFMLPFTQKNLKTTPT